MCGSAITTGTFTSPGRTPCAGPVGNRSAVFTPVAHRPAHSWEPGEKEDLHDNDRSDRGHADAAAQRELVVPRRGGDAALQAEGAHRRNPQAGGVHRGLLCRRCPRGSVSYTHLTLP